MTIDQLLEWVPGELGVVAVVSAASLLAVWIPLYRGVRLCLRARRATHRLPRERLERSLERPASGRAEPLALVMLRVLDRALRERDRGDAKGVPSDFLLDASRRYVEGEYDARYARLISMYANLLPPIGFVGTTGGMLILFLSMHLADGSLELGALALALTSSIFALVGFALLEGMKIRLYGRLLCCLEPVLDLHGVMSERARAPAS
jgi:hypothetical protein